MPFSSHAPEPCSSLDSGRPKSNSPPRPRRAASSASRSASSTERLKTPGMVPTGRRTPPPGQRKRGGVRAPGARAGGFFGRAECLVDGEIEDAGHGADRAADALAGTEKEGVDQVAGVERGFADEGPERFGAAQAAHPRFRKTHGVDCTSFFLDWQQLIFVCRIINIFSSEQKCEGYFRMNFKVGLSAICAGMLCALLAPQFCRAQQAPAMTKDQQEMVAEILREARDEVKKHYYDATLHGLDWDALYKQYTGSLAKARNLGEGYRVVAAFLEELKDSHTYFMPPWSPIHLDYGFRYALVGDTCYMTQLRPGSDAASKLQIDDQVVKMSGFTVNRGDFHDIQYYFNLRSEEHTSELQ